VNPSFWSAFRSEWIKFKSVRSTIIGLITFVVLTIGIGILVTLGIRGHINDHGGEARLNFDATSTSLVGIFLAQFAVGTIGIIMMTAEYATGSIRTTLSAVPNRTRLVVAKAAVLVAALFVLCEVTCFAAFFIGQSIYHGAGLATTLSAPGVLRAVSLAGVYLTLLGILGFGLGLIIRATAASIIAYATVLLILPIIVNFLPSAWQTHLTKFFPGELGRDMFTPSAIANDFSPTTAALMLLGYAAGLVTIGTVLLRRRDA